MQSVIFSGTPVRCAAHGNVAFAAIPTTGRRVLEHRVPDIARVLDVAVVSDDAEARLLGAIEVRHQHRCDDAKLAQLCELLGDRWCEVDAAAVVDAVSCGAPIPVATCATTVCEICDGLRRETRSAVCTRLLEAREDVARTEMLNLALAETQERKRFLTEEGVARLEAENCALAEAAVAANAARERKRLLAMGGTSVLDFGKYKGVTLEAMVTSDAAYVAWVSRGGGDLCLLPSSLVATARQLLRGRCHVCGDSVGEKREAWRTMCRECYFLRRT
jgi:hypothetical protein